METKKKVKLNPFKQHVLNVIGVIVGIIIYVYISYLLGPALGITASEGVETDMIEDIAIIVGSGLIILIILGVLLIVYCILEVSVIKPLVHSYRISYPKTDKKKQADNSTYKSIAPSNTERDVNKYKRLLKQ